MKRYLIALALLVVAGTAAQAKEHPGKAHIEKNGYGGPASCEAQECHPGSARKFLDTVHWKHASPVTNVDDLDPKKEYGMKNRIYTMCNGNDIVNNLKEIPKNPKTGKMKFTGCNTCHPGNHVSGVGSTGPEAENAIDCLVCHSSTTTYSKRKPFKDAEGQGRHGPGPQRQGGARRREAGREELHGLPRGAGAASSSSAGSPSTREHDVHAAKGMVCVDCHSAKDHKVPTGFDPNSWANDGVRVACADCHSETPHKDDDTTVTSPGSLADVPYPEDGRRGGQGLHAVDPGGGRVLRTHHAPHGGERDRAGVRLVQPDRGERPEFIGPKGSRGDRQSRIYP